MASIVNNSDYSLEFRLPRRRYKCVVAVGYHFSGRRVDSSGRELKINVGRLFRPMYETLETFQRDPALNGSALLVVDDSSPLEPPDLCRYLANHPAYAFVRLRVNVGVGGKENVIQGVGSALSSRVFRVDADVGLRPGARPLFDAFDVIGNLSCATINAGFIGYILSKDASAMPYVVTSQIGNAVMYNSDVFKTVGYSDPELRYFEDLDWVYRTWDAGYTSVMAMKVTGRTVSSGCGGTANPDIRREAARLVCLKNRSLSFTLRKSGKTPIIRYHPQRAGGLFGQAPRYVGRSGLTNSILADLNL